MRSLFVVCGLFALISASGCNDAKGKKDGENQAQGRMPYAPGINLPSNPKASQQPTKPTMVEANPDTVGTKGKTIGGDPISEPIRQMFRVQDRVLLLKVTHSLNLYKAEKGFFPRSHDAFMKELVNSPKYQLKLPELPPGQEYFFDAQQGKLMVKR